MRVALAMIVKSQGESYLDRILNVMSSSFDGVEITSDDGQPVTDFAAARNDLIRTLEAKGYDWAFMLDADECMFPEDISQVRELMSSSSDVIALPRINLLRDFAHWDPSNYPDYQGRVFRLKKGYHFRRPVHEMLYSQSGKEPAVLSDAQKSENTPIYHYGWTKPAESWLEKRRLYDGAIAGGDIAADTIADSPMFLRRAVAFEFSHPLDKAARYEGTWAQFSKLVNSVSHETSLFREHHELLGELDSLAGPILGYGIERNPDILPLSRYLSMRGQSVVLAHESDVSVRFAEQVTSDVPLLKHLLLDDVRQNSPQLQQVFPVAFSFGLLNLLDEDEMCEKLSLQLKSASRVIFSVPSDRYPVSATSQSNYWSPERWEQALAPVGLVRARYYGESYMPFREALQAKLVRSLRQDRLHVLGYVTRSRDL